jgi:hypothetical protein
MHPEFRRFVYGRNYTSLRELALEAHNIQAAVLLERSYKPPPSPNRCMEPSLAFQCRTQSHSSAPQSSQAPPATSNITQAHSQVGLGAIDSYRARIHPQSSTSNDIKDSKKPVTVQSAWRGDPQNVPRDMSKVTCYSCSQSGHIAKYCPKNRSRAKNANPSSSK